MNKARNTVWGVIFIIIAGLVLLKGFDIEILDNIKVWKIVIAALLISWLIDGLTRRDWGSILFPAAFLMVLFNIGKIIEVVAAALLGTIGLGILFGNKAKKNNAVGYIAYDENADIENEPVTDNTFTFSSSFESAVKYVKADNFERANINCSFGEMKIYFDDAQIHCDEAKINVNCKFGSVNIYVPKEWYVTNEAMAMFGAVEEKNRSITTGNPKVKIVGNVGFGNVTVTYI